MNKILVSPSSFGECGLEPLELLKDAGFEVVLNPYGRKLTENETIILGSDIIGAVAGVESYNSNVFDMLKYLKCISRVGVGIDNIDLDYAKKKGVEICITQNGPTEAVAELSITLALNLIRRISVSDRRIRSGFWKKETGNLIAGKTIGIVGLGRIGKKTASLYQSLGCSVIAYDLYPDREWMKSNDIENVTFNTLIKNANIISIHIPGMDDRKSIINTEELKQMKSNCIIINLSRGGIINENALYTHLKTHLDFFAALDVFIEEPYKGELTELDNILLTPHIGSYAKEAKLAMEIDAVNNLISSIGR